MVCRNPGETTPERTDSAYAAPPVERKLPPNLVVRFAPLGYHAEDYRQESLRDWEGWSRLEQARRDVGGNPAVARRLAFLELGLRWTETEVRAHALPADPARADREVVKRTLDERFALMRTVFRETPLALNVAYISWDEDALWSRPGWGPPARKP